jgi:diguanylate cyclase (GGDEF)-like protein
MDVAQLQPANPPVAQVVPETALLAFRDLPAETTQAFLALGRVRRLAPGEVLIAPGQVPEGLAVITSGAIAVERDGYRLRSFGSGVYLCEGCLVRDDPPEVTLRAVDDSQVYIVPRERARTFLVERPEFGVALLSRLMREVFSRLEATNRLSAENHALARALENNNVELQTTLERLADSNRRLETEVSIRRRVEDENRSLARLASDSPNPVMRISMAGVLLYANLPSLPILSHWRVAVHGRVHDQLLAEIETTLNEGQQREIEVMVGDQRYVFTLVPIPDGGHVNVYGRNVTDERHAAEHMAHLANHDTLTGLPNRKRFLDRLTDAMGSDPTRGAVFFLDLDFFKEVNDTLGHLVGDQLLQTVARRLIAIVRKTDLVARLGGDEFAILMAGGITAGPAEVHARRIIENLSRAFSIEGHNLHIGVSIGIAFFADGPPVVADVVRNADLAMYRAKADGRNTYRFFQPDFDAELRRRRELENDIRTALADNQFVLHFQPKIDLATDRVAGAEALIRWNHPRLGALGPGEFIGAAERSGLIVPLGDWVLEEALRQLGDWANAGVPPIHVAVNLSPIQIRDEKFPARVTSLLRDSGIDPTLIEFEITESVAMENVDHTLKVLGELADGGVGLSIDDFGTGYSSLSYLRRFPIDKIKIDRSFVLEMGDDGDARAIATSIVSLGHALNLAVVAEGVETEEQLQVLRDVKCNEGQGYLFSRPLPPDAFEAFVRDRAIG